MSSSDSDEFEVIEQQEASLSSQELAKVQAWLQPTDFEAQSSEFHRHLSSQAPGTGLWICETSKYQQWQKSDDHGSLWIKGVPGAGKSVTAAAIVGHLQKNEDTPILYFFFRHIISANRRPRSLIRDFLAQLLPYSVRLQATIQSLLAAELEEFSDERLWEYLLTGLSSIEKAYCVVDALDEMELLPSDGFLDRLNNLATFRPDAVKLMMTSRPKQHLQSSLRDASIVHISLEEDLVGKDISLFLSYRLKTLIPQEDQQILRDSLVSLISERSRGLFLYARLLLDQIILGLRSSEPDVERLVKDLPTGLEEMYNNMLLQQTGPVKIDVQVQVFLLELATHSSRALRLSELASALASTFPASMIPGGPKAIARSACTPLLEILEDESVQVIHHSFTEFLLNDERTKIDLPGHTPQFPVLKTDEVHRNLSVICLSYLKSGALRLENSTLQHQGEKVMANGLDAVAGIDNYGNGDGYNYQEAKLRYPFLEYAVGNWAFHASKYDFEDDDFFRSFAGFLDPNSIDFRTWLELEWTKGKKSANFQVPTPLHVAGFAGLTTYAKKLIGGEISVDSRDVEDRTPLHWACARGHISMVSILLESGASPDIEDCRGVKPIHEAARKNYARIVRMLLEAGVDPLTPKTRENHSRHLMCGETITKGETAVDYVCIQGHTDTIMIMLPFVTSRTLEEMFYQCCRYGKLEAVRAILKASGLSPNAALYGATALYLACRAKSVAIVELLLANGADVHQTSEWRLKSKISCGPRIKVETVRSPIHAAVIGWKSANNSACQQILRLLLNAGADIEAKDGKGDTPLLSLFSENKSTDIVAVKGLLQAGANVLAVGRNGDSVLHRCLSSSQDIQMLKLLFEYGASPDFLGSNGNTIMHTALRYSYGAGESDSTANIVNFLLEMGARCDVKNKLGSTAVEVAAGGLNCNLDTFTVLLQACSDEDALNRCIWTMNSRRSKDEAVKYIRAMQNFGVSLENRNSEGRTVLLVSTGLEILFEALVECGADLNAVDSNGRGVLHHYVSSGRSNIVSESLQRLVNIVEMGLDPMEVDHKGNNLLHVLAKIYTGKDDEDLFVQKFLDYGISINSKNNQGMTPLHVHLENWNPYKRRNTVNQRLDERSYERSEMPLLKIFRRSQESVEINSQDGDGVTILHLAGLRSEARLFHLIGEGADPSILTKNGRNALHLACRARQSNIVGYLCQAYKTMTNQRDSHGRTPLHDACTSGRPESVYHLLKAGADITIVDKNNRNPLHACAEFSDEHKIWTLLARRNEVSGHLLQDRFRPVLERSPRSYEPWYGSSRPSDGSTDEDIPSIGLTIKTLLLAGIDAMAKDSFYRTPLDMAIEYDCPEMVRALQSLTELVQKKWNIKPEDRRLETVMALSNSSSSIKNLQEPSRQQVLDNPSTYLAFLTFDDVEWMSQNGGSITGVDETRSNPSSGQSLLHVAVSNGFTQLVERFGPLARVNDDPKLVLARLDELFDGSISGHSPEIEYLAPMLHVACSRELSNLDMIEVLVDKCGVDVNARALVRPQQWAKLNECIEGGTALHILAEAKFWWQLDAVRYVLKKGAKIDSINEKGETPLHIACTGATFADMNCTPNVYGYWRIECVRMLLDLGANLNILDNDGLSCLHKASSSPQIMRILLEHGADFHSEKLSPAFSAIQIQCLETLTILLDAGVSPNITDQSTGFEGFQLHYDAKEKARSALFCSSFARLHNQESEDSAPIVELLIERGANLYTPLDDRETLTHYTFEHAKYEIVLAFLKHAPRIDFEARDSFGRTIFLAACDWNQSLPGYRYRCWQAKKIAPFLHVLKLGVNPLAVDNNGRNALHHLLDNPDMEDDAIIQFLARNEAKILLHQKDGMGFTPINCALRFLRPAVVEVLLTMGANFLSPDPTGATALHHIATQCLRVQIQSRGPCSGYDHDPAYYTGLLTLWKKFLALGGSINVRDNNGSPPLFSYLSSRQKDDWKSRGVRCCHLENFAVYFSEEVTKDLDFHARNNNGENVLHIIARREKKRGTKREHDKGPEHDKDLYEFFMGHGLDPLEEDEKGRSSLDIAAAFEQSSILDLFQYR